MYEPVAENGNYFDLKIIIQYLINAVGTGERVCLSAEGFGNRQCFLESIADKVRFYSSFKKGQCHEIFFTNCFA